MILKLLNNVPFMWIIRAHRFLAPPIAHLLSRLKVNIPGIVGATIKVIVVHGDLTAWSETTPSVFISRQPEPRRQKPPRK
jgi:hypothetical protein